MRQSRSTMPDVAPPSMRLHIGHRLPPWRWPAVLAVALVLLLGREATTPAPAAALTSTQVSAGGGHACAITSAGAVRCWGLNSHGQSEVPPELTMMNAATQVSAGGYHTCALTSAGEVRCWGRNDSDQTEVPDGLGTATQVSAGSLHTCAVTSAGTVTCWGDSSDGKTAVPMSLGTVTQVAAADTHTCALTSVGTVSCWGDNDYGQRIVPGGLIMVTQVSVGSHHSCALTSVGTVVCWGDSVNQAQDPPGNLGVATQLSAGTFHTCALTSAGAVVCWGLNVSGETDVPQNLGMATQVSGGDLFTCALTSAGAVACWGENVFGQAAVPQDLADATPPETSIDTSPPNPSNNASPSFAFSGTDNVSAPASHTFECSLDSGAFAPCSSPHMLSNLSEGEHTFRVRATDAALNVDPSAASYTWTVDLTPPPVPMFSGVPAHPTNQANANFSFSSSESGVTYQCRLDTGSFSACTSPHPVSGLSDAGHTFEVQAVDAAGNSSQSASHTWTVDTTPPPAPMLSGGPAGPTNQTSATFSFSSSESGVTFQCKLDTGSFSACTSPRMLSALMEGEHTFQVQAVDAVGNAGQSASHTWTVDTTPPPTPSFSQSPPTLTNQTGATFAFASSEGGVTYRCTLDMGTAEACTSPRMVSGLSDGPHTFEARAVDAAGNASSAATHTWTVDTTPPPAPTLSGQPPAITNQTSVSFGFSSSEGGVTFQCNLDAESFSVCTSPRMLIGLTQGGHTFQVQAVDAAGNTGPAAMHMWTVDTTAPLPPSIDQSPANPTNQVGASFAFSSAEVNGVFRCALDSGTAEVCSIPKSYSGLSDGSHTFRVTVSDQAGNTSTAATFTWVIDATAPAITITTNPAQPNAAGGFNQAVTATLSANDGTQGSGIASIEYRLDDGQWTAYTQPILVSGDGSHTLEARATDGLGNQSTLTRTIRIDTTPPDVQLSFDPETREVRVVSIEAGPQGNGAAQSGPVPPATCTTQRSGQTCIYRVADQGGNSVTLTLLIQQQPGRVQVQVQRIQRSGQAATTPLNNSLMLEYAPGSGTPSNTTQTLIVTEPGPPAISRQIRATWNGASNATTISFVSPAAPPLTCPGQQVPLALQVVNGVLRAGAPACATD